VRAALQRVDGEFRLVEPKSATSRRNLALADSVVETLKAHRTRQLEERLQSGSQWQDTALVFTTPTGGPLGDWHVRRRFYKILAGAGLRRQRFHDLRHACASLLLAQNVHPRVVMETLGHSTIILTMNTYPHVLPAAQREAASKIGALLEGSQPG
jgi:integrase